MCYLIYFFVLACVVCLGLFVSLYVPLSLSAVCINLPLFYCPSVCLSVSQSFYLCDCPSVCLSVCLSFYLCDCLFVYLSVFLQFHLHGVHLCLSFTFLLFTYLSCSPSFLFHIFSIA